MPKAWFDDGVPSRLMRAWGLAVLAGATLMVAEGTHAQAMYRCGATYQDRPCVSGETKVVRQGPRRIEPTDGWAVEPLCRDRGALAQRIVWEKETGRTLDEQLARNEFDPNLIKKIYALRGSSVEVRRLIEAECVKEMERPAEAAPSRLNTGNPPALPPPLPGQTGAPASSQGQGERAVADAAAKAEKCAAIDAQLTDVKGLQRSGGDAAVMDALAERVRQIQSRKRAAGCR